MHTYWRLLTDCWSLAWHGTGYAAERRCMHTSYFGCAVALAALWSLEAERRGGGAGQRVFTCRRIVSCCTCVSDSASLVRPLVALDVERISNLKAVLGLSTVKYRRRLGGENCAPPPPPGLSSLVTRRPIGTAASFCNCMHAVQRRVRYASGNLLVADIGMLAQFRAVRWILRGIEGAWVSSGMPCGGYPVTVTLTVSQKECASGMDACGRVKFVLRAARQDCALCGAGRPLNTPSCARPLFSSLCAVRPRQLPGVARGTSALDLSSQNNEWSCRTSTTTRMGAQVMASVASTCGPSSARVAAALCA